MLLGKSSGMADMVHFFSTFEHYSIAMRSIKA